MQERDALSLRADAWRLVDQTNAGVATAGERSVEIVDHEADVMDSRSPLGNELPDGRIRDVGLKQLDQRFAGGEPSDSGAIGIVQGNDGHAEDIAIEREERFETVDGDADVRDPRTTTGGFLQGTVGRRRRISGR